MLDKGTKIIAENEKVWVNDRNKLIFGSGIVCLRVNFGIHAFIRFVLYFE